MNTYTPYTLVEQLYKYILKKEAETNKKINICDRKNTENSSLKALFFAGKLKAYRDISDKIFRDTQKL